MASVILRGKTGKLAAFEIGVSAVVFGGAASMARADAPMVPYPHPLITEILYAVPSGVRGDANADGTRDAIGDEFIELVNPHDRPIQLKGYTILDASAYAPGAARPTGRPGSKPDKPSRPSAPPSAPGSAPSQPPPPANADTDRQQWSFTFPDMELKPGQVVVVFNGYKSSFGGQNAGPVGTPGRAATAVNERFHNAYVFNLGNTSPYAALGNDGDFVLLTDSSGKPVHAVKWGKPGADAKKPPSDTPLVEEAPVAVGSVQRDGPRGKLVAHKDLSGDLAGSVCSPGVFTLEPPVPGSAAKPRPSPDPKSKPDNQPKP